MDYRPFVPTHALLAHTTLVDKSVRDVARNVVVGDSRSRGRSGGTPRNRQMRAVSGEYVGFAAAH